MNIVRYLPSAQFLVIISSIAISGGLVVAAQKYTQTPQATSSLTSVTPPGQAPQQDWRAALQAIEGNKIQTPAQTASLQDTTNTLLNAAQSSNVTDTVARSLLVNLSAAKSQGLGSDIPTQDALVAQAASQINQDRGASAYSAADITQSDNSQKALKAYGNAVMIAIKQHPSASYDTTIYILATSTDNADPSKLSLLTPVGKDYALLAQELSQLPTPPALAPLHLQVVNDIARMASTYNDMKLLFTDPLRGLSGYQLYDALNTEVLRLFTNVAQTLNQNGILFTKDEPGNSWALLLSLQQ